MVYYSNYLFESEFEISNPFSFPSDRECKIRIAWIWCKMSALQIFWLGYLQLSWDGISSASVCLQESKTGFSVKCPLNSEFNLQLKYFYTYFNSNSLGLKSYYTFEQSSFFSLSFSRLDYKSFTILALFSFQLQFHLHRKIILLVCNY